jgi:hypothetical protein
VVGSEIFPPTTFVIIINWKCIGLLAALAEQFLDALKICQTFAKILVNI